MPGYKVLDVPAKNHRPVLWYSGCASVLPAWRVWMARSRAWGDREKMYAIQRVLGGALESATEPFVLDTWSVMKFIPITLLALLKVA